MAQLRTHIVTPSNAERALDIDTALEVLDMALDNVLSEYAAMARFPYAADVHGKRWDAAIGRAVAVLARPGDPADELEAAFALTCHRKG